MFDRFTNGAKKVMNLAREEAYRFHHEYLGTEHILLGLLRERGGAAAEVLRKMRIDLDDVRREVEKIVRTGPSMVPLGQLPYTPRAKKVLELALEEARGLRHSWLGTEHLLLGLIAEGQAIAAQVLLRLGIRIDEARKHAVEIRRVHLATDGPDSPLSAIAETLRRMTPEQRRAVRELLDVLDRGESGPPL